MVKFKYLPNLSSLTMNPRGRSFLRKSELRILGLLNRYPRGLTWSELLEKTGFSRSTLAEALRYLRRMKFISKAIRDDDKVVYRAEISRKAVDTLLLVEDFLNYEAFREAVFNMDKDSLFEAIIDVFVLLGSAFYSEMEVEAMYSRNSGDFERRIKDVRRRIIGAVSGVTKKIVDIMCENIDKTFEIMKREP